MVGFYVRQSYLTAVQRTQVCSKGCDIANGSLFMGENALEPSTLIVKPTATKQYIPPSADCKSDVAVLMIPEQEQPLGRVGL